MYVLLNFLIILTIIDKLIDIGEIDKVCGQRNEKKWADESPGFYCAGRKRVFLLLEELLDL